jgi:hypothetical protein
VRGRPSGARWDPISSGRNRAAVAHWLVGLRHTRAVWCSARGGRSSRARGAPDECDQRLDESHCLKLARPAATEQCLHSEQAPVPERCSLAKPRSSLAGSLADHPLARCRFARVLPIASRSKQGSSLRRNRHPTRLPVVLYDLSSCDSWNPARDVGDGRHQFLGLKRLHDMHQETC